MGEDYLGAIEKIIDEVLDEETMDSGYGITQIYEIAKKMNDHIKSLEAKLIEATKKEISYF